MGVIRRMRIPAKLIRGPSNFFFCFSGKIFFAAMPRAISIHASMIAKISVVFGNVTASERNHDTSKVKVAKPGAMKIR